MSDAKLLELAAKAAGIWEDNSSNLSGWQCNWPLGWNPLTDDGDALRLAVTLGMVIDTDYNSGVIAGNAAIELDEPEYGYQEGMGKKDLQAATRRAIVRVAAEIGKVME